MRPVRTVHSNGVFELAGGNEDNSLHVLHDTSEEGSPVIRSTWVPTDEERERIAAGENIELVVWGVGHPPVILMVDDAPLRGEPREGETFARRA